MVATFFPKKSTPGGLAVGDVLPRVIAVVEDIITFVNPELENAPTPILVTELGIVIDVNKVQLLNAPTPILVTEFGIVIDVNEVQLLNKLLTILPSDEVGVNITFANEVHPSNAASRLVTEDGIVIDVNAVQP